MKQPAKSCMSIVVVVFEMISKSHSDGSLCNLLILRYFRRRRGKRQFTNQFVHFRTWNLLFYAVQSSFTHILSRKTNALDALAIILVQLLSVACMCELWVCSVLRAECSLGHCWGSSHLIFAYLWVKSIVIRWEWNNNRSITFLLAHSLLSGEI